MHHVAERGVPECISAVRAILRRETGQDFAEYALIFALVTLVAVVAFSPLGLNLGAYIATTFGAVSAQM